MKYKVLIIIVTYNGIKWIKKCLSSVFATEDAYDCIIIDNGSTDGTQQFIKINFPDTIFIQSEKNLGFGQANNIGIKYALDNSYDFIYLLNQDAMIFSETIPLLISIFEKYPQYGILSPVQLQANLNYFDHNFIKSIVQSKSGKDYIEDIYFKKIREVYPLEDVLAANWLIKRECFNVVGGFSPSFPHYGEDNNYCDRALYHGFKIGFVPEAKAIHDTEFREISRDKAIYLTHMHNVAMLNNIYNPESFLLIRTLINSLRVAFRYKSYIPLKNLITLLLNLTQYNRNNKISKGKGAFI